MRIACAGTFRTRSAFGVARLTSTSTSSPSDIDSRLPGMLEPGASSAYAEYSCPRKGHGEGNETNLEKRK